MPSYASALSIPTFAGDVILSRVVPQVAPYFDDEFEVRVRAVEPLGQLPSFDRDAVVRVVQVEPGEPTFDETAEPTVIKPSVSPPKSVSNGARKERDGA
jgi:hypothetical protein